MKLHIKYMVSNCCKLLLTSELQKLGLHSRNIELGEVEIEGEINKEQQVQLKEALTAVGLDLLDDKKSILIEKIKNAIIELVQKNDDMPKVKLSVYLAKKLDLDYPTLSVLFSEITGTTIEQYLINIKIERVKEMLLYNEDNLTEISYKLDYSSVAHLSNQFKKVTGLTPTYFKNLKEHKRRVALEHI